MLVQTETLTPVTAAAELARRHLIDFSVFVDRYYIPSWHHVEIAEKLEAVERGEIKRLAIFMPPRHGKSKLASINFPAWYLGRNPRRQLITSSYAVDLALDFGSKTRDLVRSPEFKAVFSGVILKEDSQSKAKWQTPEGGYYISTGIGGALSGRGANCLLIDDPHKNRKEAESQLMRKNVLDWYTSTAYTRLEPDGAVILVLTRWHPDDLAGELLRDKSQGWVVVDYPAIAIDDEPHRRQGEALWPSRYDLKALESIRATLPPRDWLALYQQRPVLSETQDFRVGYFRYFEEEDVLTLPMDYYTTVDLAIGQGQENDRTAIVTVGKPKGSPNWYVVDVDVGRYDPLQVINLLFEKHTKYRCKLGIETVAYQKALLYFLNEEMKRREHYMDVVELKATGDKETRIRGLIPLYKTGVIFHRKTQCQELEAELLSFPSGKHDDIIDSLAYQLQIIEETIRQDDDDDIEARFDRYSVV